MPRVELRGTGDFRHVAQALKAAGQGPVVREMNKALRQGADPLVQEARRRVRTVPIKGARGGASARAARARAALGKKKKPSDRIKMKAFKGSGLRDTIANAVTPKITSTTRSASLRVRAAQSKMPPDQRRLPRHINTGKWRHPVFADREHWVTQTADPAWFDDSAKAKGPIVRNNAVAVVGNYLNRIV